MQQTVVVGEEPAARPIAVLRRPGSAPGLFWLGGFRSEMTGAKATALDALGARHELAVTRLDYSGHGQSGGAFEDGTISRWLEEAMAVFGTTSGPQVVIGSSMGGWLALLLARQLRERGVSRLAGMVLIAPATDMTEELMLKRLTPAQQHALIADGVVRLPSAYSDAPYPITAALLEDGRRHLLFGGSIVVGAPVVILQGGRDTDVPQEHALRLAQHLLADPVTVTLIPDGDHRLSRVEDLALLEAAVLRIAGMSGG